MEIKNTYPKIKSRINKMVRFRKILTIISLAAIFICILVNICVGGKLWFLYVVGGMIIFYVSFLNKPIVENYFMKRFTTSIFLICGYLYLIDLVEHTNWSYFVITIIGFSVLVIQIIFFLLSDNLQKKQVIPMFLTNVGAIIITILAISNVIKINWPIIVLGSLAIAIFALLFTKYRKNIIKELKKYFYIK